MSDSPRTNGALTISRLRAALASHEPVAVDARDARRAAVLVPLVDRGDGLDVLLFVRTEDVWDHKGEVCFPGGAVEPHDADAADAALREAHEELGILRSDVELLGVLDDVQTHVSGYVITPVVGFLRRMPSLALDPREVARVLVVPLEHLLDPANQGSELAEIAGVTRRRYFFPYEDARIWGATARIIMNLFDVTPPPQVSR